VKSYQDEEVNLWCTSVTNGWTIAGLSCYCWW